ncbi:MAG: MBL fold metallo-hydrolase [Gemmobacter sp.]
MTNAPFQVKLWGVRGSLPVSGKPFLKYGGNTICIEMRCGDDVLLFDAGSGLPPAGKALLAEGRRAFHVFFSHWHYDHLMGLPFFVPLYDHASTVTLWSGHMAGAMSTAQMLTEFMRPPFFPIGPEMCRSCVTPTDFTPGQVLSPYPGVTVRTGLLNHPGGSVGYRVEFGGKAVALITDTEHDPGTLDRAVLDLIEGADLVLYDASFEDEELRVFKGFGHSSWQQGIRLAQAAGAQQLGFIHHAKWRTDVQLSRIERMARKEFPAAFCGQDGQVIEV